VFGGQGRAELVEHAVPPEIDIQVLGRDAMEAIHPAFEAAGNLDLVPDVLYLAIESQSEWIFR